MTVRERLLAIKLLEQQEKDPEYLKQLGIHITMNRAGSAENERSE